LCQIGSRLIGGDIEFAADGVYNLMYSCMTIEHLPDETSYGIEVVDSVEVSDTCPERD
jgi:hypothetical protein